MIVYFKYADSDNMSIIKLIPSIKQLNIDDFLIANVTIKNFSNHNLTELSAYIITPGFTIEQKPNWPDILYPTSEITEYYLLKANKIGEHKIWASITYSHESNNTNLNHFSLVSDSYIIKVKPSGLDIKLDNYWIGVITTVIGAIIGATIPEFYNQINKHREYDRERKTLKTKIKNLLLLELDDNKKLLEKSEPCSTQNWSQIVSEHYYLLSENDDLVKLLSDLYSQFKHYNSLTSNMQLNEDKNRYFHIIKEARKKLEIW